MDVRVRRRSEEFIYDVFKLAIVEALFHYFAMIQLGTTACIIIIVLVVWRQRKRLNLGGRHAASASGGDTDSPDLHSRPSNDNSSQEVSE